jgi:copper chaperone
MSAESEISTATPLGPSADPVAATYTVSGMTCGHCVHAVTTELGAIAGVHEVHVDLTTGDVRVSSTRRLDVAEVRTAIDEAGYQLG